MICLSLSYLVLSYPFRSDPIRSYPTPFLRKKSKRIPRLEACRAELVVRPRTVDADERLASSCAEHQVPLTLRGSGTGNYGQCVPLQGGVVMLTTALRQIRAIDPPTFSTPSCLRTPPSPFCCLWMAIPWHSAASTPSARVGKAV